ncbi:hypothetical protein ILUMI_19939 [Ignelater luminosus]|uniref:Uncharacterized protein n=1 Tax=Ignelater luminosus TaxID=2038154 RepID=A0A8K0CH91_IGNLU|nr:hypothetical protein ILUMI_19939 [Ignelater luminosus]
MEHTLEGKLLSLPLEFDGKSIINFTSLFDRIKVRFKSVKREEQIYFAVDKLSVEDFVADIRIEMVAKNPENQSASDFISNFINTNSKQVFDRYSILYKETCKNILRSLVDGILEKKPAKKLFSE